MGWIAAEDYGSARPDPLAEAAPGIIRHMNTDHSDALLLIARQLAGETADEGFRDRGRSPGVPSPAEVWRQDSRPESGFFARGKKY
jgi:Protein of unknown function (DUF2470)